eukprot:m.53778 g.53778  ORF g.53778 m.53778 type:complete len:379 (+) comp12410_c0_seq1:223-1359(+)
MAADSGDNTVVVVGAGIVGAAVAYYLTVDHHRKVILLEQCSVACHSSGKAGGFLARSWCDGMAMEALARGSFDLHQALADTFGAESIGYRRVRCVGTGPGGRPLPGAETWLDHTTGVVGAPSSTPEDCAQVTPAKLTRALVDAVVAAGGELYQGTEFGVRAVEQTQEDEHGDGSSSTSNPTATAAAAVVTVGGRRFEAPGGVVFALGAWSSRVAQWFPLAALPVSSTAGHRYTSLVWDTSETNATAVFLDSRHSVEIYPRPDETYACGCVDASSPLPDDPRDIVPKDALCSTLQQEAERCSSVLQNATVVKRQACHLPTSDTGLPVIGLIPHTTNAYIACGHTCWGILNGPMTGKALAALVVGEQPTVDLTPFAPGQA